VNTHIQILKVWHKSVLSLLKYSFFLGDCFSWCTLYCNCLDSRIKKQILFFVLATLIKGETFKFDFAKFTFSQNMYFYSLL